MEILGVKNGYFNVFSDVFSTIWLESGKMCKNKSTFFIFTMILQIFPVFFSPGRDQLLERAGQENIGPRISPLHEFWIVGLDSSTQIG